MRPTLPYVISTLLHVSVLGGAACWLTFTAFEGPQVWLTGSGGGSGDRPLPGPPGGSSERMHFLHVLPASNSDLPPAPSAAEMQPTENAPLATAETVQVAVLANTAELTAPTVDTAEMEPATLEEQVVIDVPPTVDGPAILAANVARPTAPRVAADTPRNPAQAAAKVKTSPGRQVSTQAPVARSNPIAGVHQLAGGGASGAGAGGGHGSGGSGSGTGGSVGSGSGGGGFGGGAGDSLPGAGPANREPVYPLDALRANAEGVVLLHVWIAADGTVTRLKLHRSSGWPSMDESALAAVREWRFSPARQGGVPVACEVLKPIRFQLRD